ncbi:MAG: HPr(Ser) kinase/phosphatase [Fusobacterium sp.]|uniref:HPr(Ser) kinase/phosphatase n=1 Tax=Fusobacterium sp. TaxID=68766 RepID=UPI0026DBFE78|nr:HPr(Ser) kinase/phosphatase [Fusobacterium sp.]MDO4690968.1 HPr(Ser) kinase/phosphatase [Fusobacterium sp.]
MHTFTTVREIAEKLDLIVINEGNLDIKLDISNLYQIGYELVGFLERDSDELNKYINICGLKESTYIETFDKERRDKIISAYMSLSFPALIFSKDAAVTEEFLFYAKKFNKNVLKSKEKASVTIRKLKFFLSKALSVEEVYPEHSLLEIHGVGVLITGELDTRKAIMMELISHGHRMITDKNVVIRRTGERELIGYNQKKRDSNAHFLLEDFRGNYIDITTHFGVKATRKEKLINILIVLEKWDDKKFYDRLGLDEEFEIFVGEKIRKITLPVRKGRNLAVIIETAALNYRLRKMGLNTPLYFLKKSQELIQDRKEGKIMTGEKKLSVNKIFNEFDLQLIYGEERLENTFIKSTNIYRPSLSLIGFFDLISEAKEIGIQVFSHVEFKFLESLDENERINNLKKYLSYDFPFIVLTSGFTAPKYFMDAVKESGHILAIAPYKKSSQIIANFNNYLDSYFSETVSVHGVFVELFGFGVLLTGKSGIGKSETALELIHRGHRLISDDIVRFYKDTQGDIIGKSADIPFFMEIRGLGIIDIKTLYGLSAVRITKRLDLIIELKGIENTDYMSTPTENTTIEEMLGNSVKKKILEISTGRNAAAMVEVIVMDHMSGILGQK